MKRTPRQFPDRRRLPDRRRRGREAFRRHRRGDETVSVLGGVIDLVRPEEVLHHLECSIDAGGRTLVANHNVNSLSLMRRDPQMAEFYHLADMVELDSTPVVYFGRLLGLRSRPFHRCTYLDWRDHFWSLADRNGWTVAYLGGAPGVAEAAAEKLGARYPGATIRTRHGYFDSSPQSADNQAILAWLDELAPQVLFVGMGMPRQEHWIVENYDALPPCAVFSVGAAFDYEAGVQKAAPRWMGALGAEWFYRLVHDPRRLFRRYCVDPWSLIPSAQADVTKALRLRFQGLFERHPASVRGSFRPESVAATLSAIPKKPTS